MKAWLAIAAVGAGTYGLRASLILIFRGTPVPPVLARAFRYVGPAVLAALSVPGMLAPDGVLDLTGPRVPAAIVAVVVAWRTRNLLLTLLAGLGVFFALELLF